jgi:hypothetical protein
MSSRLRHPINSGSLGLADIAVKCSEKNSHRPVFASGTLAFCEIGRKITASKNRQCSLYSLCCIFLHPRAELWLRQNGMMGCRCGDFRSASDRISIEPVFTAMRSPLSFIRDGGRRAVLRLDQPQSVRLRRVFNRDRGRTRGWVQLTQLESELCMYGSIA